MKKTLLLLAAVVGLAGCTTTNKESEKDNDSVINQYIDDGTVISVNDFEFRLDINTQGTAKKVYLPLYVTSKKLEKTELVLKNGYLYRESNGAKYEVFSTETLQLENDVEDYNLFSATLPSSLSEEKYQFIFEVLDTTVKYYLYNNPANYFTVSYKAENKIVHTETVHKGDYYKGYTYGFSNHLQYAKSWHGQDKTVTARTPITENVTLVAIEEEAVKYITTNLDTYSWISSFDYVFEDGICVLREEYKSKPIGIVHQLSSTLGIKDLYLPESLVRVGSRVFKNVENLTIHYPGTEDEWNTKFSYDDGFGAGTKIVFNSSYC